MVKGEKRRNEIHRWKTTLDSTNLSHIKKKTQLEALKHPLISLIQKARFRKKWKIKGCLNWIVWINSNMENKRVVQNKDTSQRLLLMWEQNRKWMIWLINPDLMMWNKLCPWKETVVSRGSCKVILFGQMVGWPTGNYWYLAYYS